MAQQTARTSRFFRFRRAFLFGLAAGSLVAATIAGLTPAFAQTEAQVDVEKLMAETELQDLAVGSPDAKITIVEYASMTCGYCGAFHTSVYKDLKEKYIDTGKVRFVFREFPLDNLAAAASMLGRCTDSTDKALKLASVLFEKQREWVVQDPVPQLFEIAKQAGFTEEKFNECLQNQELLAKISAQRDRASEEFGVRATPTFFINGQRLTGRADQLSTFEEAIEPLLEKDGA